MKRFIVVIILLGVVISPFIYFYKTDDWFRTEIANLLNPQQPKPEKTDSIQIAEPVRSNKKKTPGRKRIPKTVQPDKYATLDEYAINTPAEYEKDIVTLSKYLTKPAKNDLEKVRAVFTWVATHVKYDADAFNSGNYADYNAANVLASRSAVCDGYGNLMEALCKAAGFEAVKVSGYAKGYGYHDGDEFKKTDHAWNAVKIGDTWHLFDATWGGGYGVERNGKMVAVSRFEPYWFDVDPKAFIFSHLPEDSKWQLIGQTITLKDFEKYPNLDESFFKLGFNPAEILAEVISGHTKNFVQTFPTAFPVKVIQIPLAKNQYVNTKLTFVIESEYAEEIALIDDHSWNYFKKDGNKFTLNYQPKGMQLEIGVKINWYDTNFSLIAKYDVKKLESVTAMR
jgi:hypothetical protein